MVVSVQVEVRVSHDGERCEDCPFGTDETCGLSPMADGRGVTREHEADGRLYYRTRACLAAERKAKGDGK